LNCDLAAEGIFVEFWVSGSQQDLSHVLVRNIRLRTREAGQPFVEMKYALKTVVQNRYREFVFELGAELTITANNKTASTTHNIRFSVHEFPPFGSAVCARWLLSILHPL
jgi:hypothetical protein